MSERHKYKPVAVRDTFEELTEDDLNVLSIGGRLRRRRIDAEGAAEVEIDSDDPEGDLDDEEKEELIKDWGFFRIARFLITCVLAGLSFIFFVDFLVKRAPASWTEPYEPGDEKFRDRIENLTYRGKSGPDLYDSHRASPLDQSDWSQVHGD